MLDFAVTDGATINDMKKIQNDSYNKFAQHELSKFKKNNIAEALSKDQIQLLRTTGSLSIWRLISSWEEAAEASSAEIAPTSASDPDAQRRTAATSFFKAFIRGLLNKKPKTREVKKAPPALKVIYLNRLNIIYVKSSN